MTPRDYLLHLRASQQELVGYDPDVGTCRRPEAWRRLVSPEADAFLEREYRLRAEDLGSYNDVLLVRLQAMIEGRCPECRTADFAVGELFLSYPQALILHVPNTLAGFVIALHTHLCHLLRYVTEVAMIRMRLDNGLPVSVARESLYPWFDGFVRFFLLGQGSAPPIPETTEPEHLVITELVYVASVLWILCHEYGHYLAGHFDGRRLHAFELGGISVRSCEGSSESASGWERELDADAIGCKLLARAVTDESFRYGDAGETSNADRIQLASWGVDVAVGLLGLVDRRYVLHGGRRYVPGSHPPAHLRLQHMRRIAPQMFPAEPVFASIITGYFDALYRGLPGSLALRPP